MIIIFVGVGMVLFALAVPIAFRMTLIFLTSLCVCVFVCVRDVKYAEHSFSPFLIIVACFYAFVRSFSRDKIKPATTEEHSRNHAKELCLDQFNQMVSKKLLSDEDKKGFRRGVRR